MKNEIIAGILFAVSFVAVTLVMWLLFPNLTGDQSMAGLSGAFGGAVGGILGTTYLSRFRDERFTLIENRSAHNAFIFLLIALPISIGIIGLSETPTVELALSIVLGTWLVSLVIFGLSMFYYYRR